jgi:hypothetical protein
VCHVYGAMPHKHVGIHMFMLCHKHVGVTSSTSS